MIPRNHPAELSLLAERTILCCYLGPEAAWHKVNDMHRSSIIAHHRFLAHGPARVAINCLRRLARVDGSAAPMLHCPPSTPPSRMMPILEHRPSRRLSRASSCALFFFFFLQRRKQAYGVTEDLFLSDPEFGRSQQCGMESRS